MLRKKVIESVEYTFNGLPVLGNVKLLFKTLKYALGLEWDGSPSQIIEADTFEALGNIDKKWFKPIDKGEPGLVLFNKDGDAFARMSQYPGTGTPGDGPDSKPHFWIKSTL